MYRLKNAVYLYQSWQRKLYSKLFVTDMFETNDIAAQPMEFTAYTINCKLESGKKYLVTYKLVPHPYKGQQLTMLITGATQADDSVSNFVVTPEVKQNLEVIRSLPGTVEGTHQSYNGKNERTDRV